MSSILSAQGKVEITLTSTQKIAVYTEGTVIVRRKVGYPNYPDQLTTLGTVSNGTATYGTYTGGATIILDNTKNHPVFYDVGTAPVVTERLSKAYQPAPATATNTATLTVSDVLAGLVVGTPTAAATYTLPTGTLLDAAATFEVGDSFDWTIVNAATTAAYIITLAAGTDHTIVGSVDVAANHATTGGLYGSAGRFRTRKTAANTFITYRLS
ncbi:tail fiber protein [Caudoviricetes sp.]|nr:tail fiber protein [Caudoviricetes sp.]